mmetsp:Transcript_947/g.2842  ORF Transcript_947/g.2842 Transcript_947/m.2842 type:complete len:494 (-) Transcript_947:112-1593(-)
MYWHEPGGSTVQAPISFVCVLLEGGVEEVTDHEVAHQDGQGQEELREVAGDLQPLPDALGGPHQLGGVQREDVPVHVAEAAVAQVGEGRVLTAREDHEYQVHQDKHDHREGPNAAQDAASEHLAARHLAPVGAVEQRHGLADEVDEEAELGTYKMHRGQQQARVVEHHGRGHHGHRGQQDEAERWKPRPQGVPLDAQNAHLLAGQVHGLADAHVVGLQQAEGRAEHEAQEDPALGRGHALRDRLRDRGRPKGAELHDRGAPQQFLDSLPLGVGLGGDRRHNAHFDHLILHPEHYVNEFGPLLRDAADRQHARVALVEGHRDHPLVRAAARHRRGAAREEVLGREAKPHDMLRAAIVDHGLAYAAVLRAVAGYVELVLWPKGRADLAAARAEAGVQARHHAYAVSIGSAAHGGDRNYDTSLQGAVRQAVHLPLLHAPLADPRGAVVRDVLAHHEAGAAVHPVAHDREGQQQPKDGEGGAHEQQLARLRRLVVPP